MSYLTDEIRKRVDSGEITLDDIKTSVDNLEKEKNETVNLMLDHPRETGCVLEKDEKGWGIVDLNESEHGVPKIVIGPAMFSRNSIILYDGYKLVYVGNSGGISAKYEIEKTG